MDAYHQIRKGERAVVFTMFAYVALSLLKLAVGYAAGSEALKADGWNNMTDIVVSLAVWIGLRISRKPPDRDHPYGHFRAETVAALVAALIMMSVGLQVIWQAGRQLFAPETATPDAAAAWTALFCAVAMYFVYRYNLRLAKSINSRAMIAAAQDNRSDALVSAGAFLGIFASRFGWPWLDAVTAAAVGAVICKTAWDIFKESTHALTDGFDQEQLGKFKSTISAVPGVESVRDIRARVHGNQVLIEVTVEVDHELNVVESHDITERIEHRMKAEHQVEYVHVHIEPALAMKKWSGEK